MAVEDSVADDMLRSGYERWYRLEEEKAAIGADLKELFAELKANGFTPKALRESFRRVRNINDADQQEHDAIVDLYVASLTGARPAHARVEIVEEFDAETGEITEPQPPKAAGQAERRDPVAFSGESGATTSPVENEAAEISTPITEPTQASNDVGSGQAAASIPLGAAAETTPAAVEGQRSTPVTDVGGSGEAIQPETATSGEGAAAPATGESPVIESAGDTGAQPAGGENEEVAEALNDTDTAAAGSGLDNDCTVTGDGSSELASISDVESVAPKYAAPGVVTTEHTPPEPVKWHPYAQCFPTVLGDDLKALERDIQTAFGGVKDPIVKIGNLILDGRARYGIARSMLIDYPVVQYDGSDPLIDVIRWNLASRFDRMTSGQIAATAKALCKLEPHRADDIMQAFGLEAVETAQ